jgi:hypothetical protein
MMQTSSHDELSPGMIEAMRALDSHGLIFRRTSKHQLKIGRFNFWPSTGAITEDDYGRRSERGLGDLINVIQRLPTQVRSRY